ncbi:MAG: stage III sporulation protein AE [Candidatus Borkfalkiaceae bacterium]|nr:stage III sporulation protein AE [Christensenellaceae bacterium]
MKKKGFALILFLLFCLLLFSPVTVVVAEDGEKEDFNETVEEMIDRLDLSFFEEYRDLAKTFFGKDGTLRENLLSAMKGETSVGYDDLFSYLKNLLLSSVREKGPLFASLFCLIVFCSLARAFSPTKNENGTGEIVHFVSFAVIVGAVSACVAEAMAMTKETVGIMSAVVEGALPVLLSVMSATGQTASVSVFAPAASFFTVATVSVIENVVLPTVSLLLVISVVSDLGKGVRLDRLFSFFQSMLKWLIGLFGATFSLYLTVRGFASSSFDGITLRTLKYAVGNSVPYVGGILREGADVILLSAAIVKNALGVFTLLIVFSAALAPVLNVVALQLTFRLLAGITEPMSSDARIGDFFGKTATVLNFLAASILLAGFVFLVFIVMLLVAGTGVI